MLLARVIGTVWATRKDEKLEGMRLLVVRALDLELKPLPSFLIAVDSVSAGVGEVVLVAQGSSARQTTETFNRPVDAVIMAIVDNLDYSSIDELEREYKQREESIHEKLKSLTES